MSDEGRQPLAADRLLDVLDDVSVLIYVHEPDGRFVHANRAACEFIGKPPEEVIGKRPADFFDAATAERWAEQNRELLSTGRPLDFEVAWRGRTHATHKTPVFDKDGKPVAVIGISTDITARKNAEDSLRRNEHHLHEAQQIAGVGSWHWDTASHALSWSTEMCRLYGVSPEDAPTGDDALLLIDEGDHEAIRRATSAALAGVEPMDLDIRIRRGDGQIRILHCRGSVTIGPGGSPHRLDGTCVDVTDRRRAERRLAEAQRLAQLGSWDWDVARDEITWSREMYRIFGEDPEHFVPTRAIFYERIVPEDLDVIAEQVRVARELGGEFHAFARIRLRDGQLRDVLFRGAMVTTPGSSGDHFLGICQDMTDVRRAEEARAVAVERFRLVFERAPVAMALMMRDGRFELVNEAMAEFLGRPAAELLELGMGDVTHPADLPDSLEVLERTLAGELAEYNVEKRYLRSSGEFRWGALRALLLYDADGVAANTLVLIRDITDQRLAERRLSALHGVARIMAGGAMLSEALPAIVETVVRELGWERGALWLRDTQGELQYAVAWPLGSAPPDAPALPADAAARDGTIAIPVVGGTDVLGLLEFAGEPGARLDDDLAGLAAALGAQVGDFLVRKRADERVLHQALHDPLTGLPNRVLFFDRLDHAILRLRREHAPLAVLFIDFDGFKAVNDRFGHAGGDEVLRRVAERVGAALRAEDTVARFGGDELVVLSEHVAGAAGATMIADRILEQLASPIELDGEPVLLTASIGICVAPVEGATRDALLHTADSAMYQAKATGRGRYVIAEA